MPALQYSPSELLLGRILKSKIPISCNSLKPRNLNHDLILEKHKDRQNSLKNVYDKTAKDLDLLKIDENILYQDKDCWKKGKVKQIINDRSYNIINESGMTLRRNRKYLKKTKLEFEIK